MRHLATLVLCASLFGCSSFFGLTASVQSICLTYPNLQFDVPAQARALPTLALSRRVEFDVSEYAASIKNLEGDIRLDTVTITSHDVPLDFVDSASVALVTTADGGVTSRRLAEVHPATGAMSVSAPLGSLEVSPYVDHGTLTYDVELTGRAPPATLTLDVDVCATATAYVPF